MIARCCVPRQNAQRCSQRDDDDPQQGRGVIVWAFGAFLVALAIAVAVL